MAGAGNRPLSPHLQIWRWGPAMLVSILHRATGTALAIGGLALMLWWLGALASGPDAYATFTGWTFHPGDDATGLQKTVSVLVRFALFGLTWAFWQHLASGVRHFFLDVGAGYELETNAKMSVATIVISVLLTIFTWILIIRL